MAFMGGRGLVRIGGWRMADPELRASAPENAEPQVGLHAAVGQLRSPGAHSPGAHLAPAGSDLTI